MINFDHHALAPTAMCLQLADQSVRYPMGVAENIPVKIRNFFIPIDFIILNMEVDTKTPTHSSKAVLEHGECTHSCGGWRNLAQH
jgi:hypothetical protein